MAHDLHSLIRLAKSRVDERQRHLANLLRRSEDQEAHRVALDHRLAQERLAARSDPVLAGLAYGAFACEAVARRGRLSADIAVIEGHIDTARDGLSSAYRELRTLETAQERRDRQRATAAARAEQAALDEIGLNGYLRRAEG